VIVDDLNVMSLAVTPDEANPPSIVDPYTVLSSPISLECFEMVARRHTEILQPPARMQVEQLAPRHAFDCLKLSHGPSASVSRHRNDRIKVHSMTRRVFRQPEWSSEPRETTTVHGPVLACLTWDCTIAGYFRRREEDGKSRPSAARLVPVFGSSSVVSDPPCHLRDPLN
jgi:hypothetical protein